MKSFQLFLVILAGITFRIEAQNMNWTLVNTGTTKNIRDISFINRDTGFIAGDNGLLRYTTNGGTTWADMVLPSTGQGAGNNNNIKVAQFSRSNGPVTGILFFGTFTGINRMYDWPASGWMEECGGSMFVYNDSVCSINNYHDTPSAIGGFCAGSSCTHEGGMFGNFGGFCFTFDTLLTKPGFAGWNDVSSYGTQTAVMVGDDGYYYRITGLNDTIIQHPEGNNFSSVDFSGSQVVYAITDNMFSWQLKRSTDAGLTFATDSSLMPTFWYPQIKEIDFIENDWGVMAGIANSSSGIIITKRGNSIDFFSTDSALTSVQVMDSTLAFAGGLNGKLYKYEALPGMGVETTCCTLDFELFPNPQTPNDPFLNVRCQHIIDQLMVCDITGKVLFTRNSAGAEYLQLDTSFLVPGIYVLKIFTGKGSGTKKFVVN